MNLRQAETSADIPDNKTSEESNHVLVRSFSTIQRHVSLRLQNISSHLRKDLQDNNTNGSPNETIDEDVPYSIT